ANRQRVAADSATRASRIVRGLGGGWATMGWQIVIWVAGATTAAAVLTAGWPLVSSARTTDPRRRSVTIAASAVVVTTVLGVALNGLVGLPAGVRATWALSTAYAACWLAVRARELSRDGCAFRGRPQAAAAGSDAHSDALSAQDDVVQALVVASYALQMGDNSRASAAVDGALRRSRARLDALVREHDQRDLIRREAAQHWATGEA
ncbi:hypothetical protein, partial [Frankia sp. CiP3]